VLADVAHAKGWKAAIAVGTAGAAFGFIGFVISGVVEAVRSYVEDRPPRWGEVTVLGTLLLGLFAVVVEVMARL
jgi:hypothetical protein